MQQRIKTRTQRVLIPVLIKYFENLMSKTDYEGICLKRAGPSAKKKKN